MDDMLEAFSVGATIAGWLVGKSMEGALGAAGRVLKDRRQTRALAEALEAALAEFEKCHPALVRSLFDETFLERPEIKAELTRLISVRLPRRVGLPRAGARVNRVAVRCGGRDLRARSDG